MYTLSYLHILSYSSLDLCLVLCTLWVKVSDLGQIDNPNTTPTKDYEKASGGVPPQYQRGFTYGEGDASTPKG